MECDKQHESVSVVTSWTTGPVAQPSQDELKDSIQNLPVGEKVAGDTLHHSSRIRTLCTNFKKFKNVGIFTNFKTRNEFFYTFKL